MSVLSMHAMSVGLIIALLAIVSRTRASAEAAFDIGVEVGARRARRVNRPVVVKLPDERRTIAGQRGSRH